MSNKLKFFLLILSAGLFFLRKSSLALAQGYQLQVPLPGVSGTVSGPGQYIRAIFTYGLSIVGIAALWAIVIGGFKYLRSGGSETRKTSGKEWIWGAVIGLVLMLCSWLILNTINPKLTSLSEPGLETIDMPEFADSPLTNAPSAYGQLGGSVPPAGSISTPTRPQGSPNPTTEEALAKSNELGSKLTYAYSGDPASGATDCSGGAQRWRVEMGGTNPGRGSMAQLAEAKSSGYFSNDLNGLQPGDEIIRTAYSGSRSGYHIGVYAGNNQVWDSKSGGFKTESLNSFMQRGQLLGINKWH